MTPLGHDYIWIAGLLVGLLGLAVAFAATAAVLHLRAARTERRRAARWARWEPGLLDALVGAGDAAAFAATVTRPERADALALLVAYALRLGGESLATLAVAAGPLLPDGRAALRSPRADRRAASVRLLGLLGAEADRPALADALRDPVPAVAMAAARALARTQDARFVEPVVGALGRFEPWGPTAVASMLALYGLAAGPALARTFADAGARESVRVVCAEALRRLGFFPAAPAAARIATETPPERPPATPPAMLPVETPPATLAASPAASVELCTASLRLLRDVGGPAEAWAVRPLLSSPHAAVRLHAVSTLAAISQDPADAARIEHALGDASAWVAQRAARGLIESGRAAHLHALAAGDAPRNRAARQALAEAGLAPADRAPAAAADRAPAAAPEPVPLR